MAQQTLTGYTRTDFKKSITKTLRKEGKIPAVIYGHAEPVAIAIEAREFDKKFHTISENTLITLTVDKKSYDVLIKDYQEDILCGEVRHLDFFEIEKGKMLKTKIPVHLHGVAPGVKEGGHLEHVVHEVEVECLPKDIPSEFMLDISSLVVGKSLHVSDIAAPEGVKILASMEQTVCLVAIQKAEVTVDEEEVEGTEEAAEESSSEE